MTLRKIRFCIVAKASMTSGYESTYSYQPFCTHSWGDGCILLFQSGSKYCAQQHSAFLCPHFMISIHLSKDHSVACTLCTYALNHKSQGCCVPTLAPPTHQSAWKSCPKHIVVGCDEMTLRNVRGSKRQNMTAAPQSVTDSTH